MRVYKRSRRLKVFFTFYKAARELILEPDLVKKKLWNPFLLVPPLLVKIKCDEFHRYEKLIFRVGKMNYASVVEGAVLTGAVLKGRTKCAIL